MGFEPTFSAGERLQTYVLDRAVTKTGLVLVLHLIQHQHVDFPCKRLVTYLLYTFSVQSSVHLFAVHEFFPGVTSKIGSFPLVPISHKFWSGNFFLLSRIFASNHGSDQCEGTQGIVFKFQIYILIMLGLLWSSGNPLGLCSCKDKRED